MVPDCTGTAQAYMRPSRPQGPAEGGSKVLLFYGYQLISSATTLACQRSTGGAIDTYVRINRKYGYSQLARGHGSEKNVNNKQRP
ncbi:hypothetical protein CGCA056_v012352 [Colletotrichum aenigma]|uniref:uncharacterized protein n=1 Tax=Colletotrichum aenigma TaxID=1215731 RepID=UPI001872D58C|nr:uncharacterized protein CGCA056_v012352 [Colletotrichum aenigma]KAF5513020.1 hypothetical protein CGCA056_v012352 [Colletotrichum aenigma]